MDGFHDFCMNRLVRQVNPAFSEGKVNPHITPAANSNLALQKWPWHEDTPSRLSVNEVVATHNALHNS